MSYDVNGGRPERVRGYCEFQIYTPKGFLFEVSTCGDRAVTLVTNPGGHRMRMCAPHAATGRFSGLTSDA